MQQGPAAGEAVLADGDRRFLLLVAATAGLATRERLRALLGVPGFGARVRVATVATVGDIVRQLRPGEIPVAVGGDGTANQVARALLDAATPPVMGLLPLGTGNALAHAFGVGRVRFALEALRAGRPRAVDVMLTSHPTASLALASLSAGFEGRFLMRYATLRVRGRMQAGLRSLRAAGGPRGRIVLTADGVELTGSGEHVFNAGLYNIPCYAGGHTVWPAAEPGDGEAEAVVCTSAAAYWRTLALGLRTDTPGASGGRRFRRWRKAHLDSAEPIQFDGEWAPAGRIDVRLEHGALNILVPPAAAPA